MMFKLILRALLSAFRSRQSLLVENAALRHQIEVLQRNSTRPRLRWRDRAFWDILSCLSPDWRRSLYIVQPDAVVRWHRQGFRFYWRWKSRPRRPGRSDRPPSQPWRTFLVNHARDIASIDFFTVPTTTFRVLYVNVTAKPTAGWTGQQVAEAFPWDTVPRYLIRDRDGIYGHEFCRRAGALGIEQVVISRRSPWQNPFVERVIGSILRECLDHVIVFNERHLRRELREYVEYYNRDRTHLGLEKDCPESRSVEPPENGSVQSVPILGGLHNRNFRRAA